MEGGYESAIHVLDTNVCCRFMLYPTVHGTDMEDGVDEYVIKCVNRHAKDGHIRIPTVVKEELFGRPETPDRLGSFIGALEKKLRKYESHNDYELIFNKAYNDGMSVFESLRKKYTNHDKPSLEKTEKLYFYTIPDLYVLDFFGWKRDKTAAIASRSESNVAENPVYPPSHSDLMILAAAVRIANDDSVEIPVCVFTRDSDLKSFTIPIKEKLDVTMISKYCTPETQNNRPDEMPAEDPFHNVDPRHDVDFIPKDGKIYIQKRPRPKRHKSNKLHKRRHSKSRYAPGSSN
ncbi:MAG: hypothetical protein MPJ08_01170 [Nitrosopumilus sp.]|nr:hypothetical protein [Nitrosopumilus sp.]